MAEKHVRRMCERAGRRITVRRWPAASPHPPPQMAVRLVLAVLAAGLS